MIEGIFLAMIPIALLAPVFIIRGIGAGDLKILSVAAVYMDRSGLFRLIIFSFLIGAVISAYKIIREGQILVRISSLRAYVVGCMADKKIVPYQTLQSHGSYVKLSGCMFAGLIIQTLMEVSGYQ